MGYRSTAFGISIWAALAAAGNAHAAQAGPQGIPLGGFRLYPAARLSIAYDDNIYRRSNPESDTMVTLTPSVRLQSIWAVHELSVSATSSIRRYFKHSTENRQTWRVDASGRADVDTTFALSPSIGYGHQAIIRGSTEDDAQLRKPTYYYQFDAGITAYKRFNRLSLSTSYKQSRLSYENIHENGSLVRLSSSNQTTRSVSVEVGYDMSERTSFFVAATGNRKRYRHQPFGVNRNSQGYTLLGGIKVQPSAVISGQLGVGYISQKFKNPLYSGFHGINYNANILWLPTQLTAVTLTASRSLQNSTLIGVPAVLNSAVGISVDHELYRNLTVSVHGQYEHQQYRGIHRVQDRYSAGISAKRTFNDYLVAAVSYDHLRQNSRILGGRDYRSNRVSLSLTVSR